jgi:5-methylcytosine-specific restriction endonuclease McrA
VKRRRLDDVRPRRQPVTYTILPGGVRLSFHGYLDGKLCSGPCGQRWPAAAYAKAVYFQSGRRWLRFGPFCLLCDPPPDFPRDLSGVRPTSTYTDAAGHLVGWRERDRERGLFGPEIPLEQMGFRKTADGVVRPQPKLDRRSKTLMRERPRPPKSFRPVRARTRNMPKAWTNGAARLQGGRCKACGCTFTADNPAVGDHDLPYADGWPTDQSNCIALCVPCNREKGRRGFREFMRDKARLF